jgi:hypothetical protein
MRFVDSEYLRQQLLKRMGDRTQTAFAAEIGIKPQHLSLILKGSPIYGKALAFLGYERVNDLYRRASKRKEA